MVKKPSFQWTQKILLHRYHMNKSHKGKVI